MARGYPNVFVTTLLSFPSKFATEIRHEMYSAQNIRRPIQSTAIPLGFAFSTTMLASAPLISFIHIWLLSSTYNFISTVSTAITVLHRSSLVKIALPLVGKWTMYISSFMLMNKYAVRPGQWIMNYLNENIKMLDAGSGFIIKSLKRSLIVNFI